MPLLIARLLLDAESELARAADAVPETARDVATGSLNTSGWIVAHAACFLDVWLSVDAQGRELDAGDAWLRAWMEPQRSAGDTAIDRPFQAARPALERASARTRNFVESLGEEQLARVPARIAENGWPEGTTVGYLVARSIAHLRARLRAQPARNCGGSGGRRASRAAGAHRWCAVRSSRVAAQRSRRPSARALRRCR